MTEKIYFARAGADGPIKIGVTGGDPARRIAAISTGCPWPVSLIAVRVGSSQHEEFLHRKFAAHRLNGEWFSPAEELLNLIDGLQDPLFEWPAEWHIDGERNAIFNIRLNVFDGISQASFGEIAGTTQATVSRWETGELSPNSEQMGRIRAEANKRGLSWNDQWFFESPETHRSLRADKSSVRHVTDAPGSRNRTGGAFPSTPGTRR